MQCRLGSLLAARTNQYRCRPSSSACIFVADVSYASRTSNLRTSRHSCSNVGGRNRHAIGLSNCAAVAGTTVADQQRTPLSAQDITILIKECETFNELESLLLRYNAVFNFIHAAAAFTHAAQLAAAAAARPAAAIAQQQQKHSRQPLDHQTLHQLLQLLPDLLQVVQQQCPNFQGRQVANCMWACHKLLQLLSQVQQNQQQQCMYPQQQLSLLTRQLQDQADHCWHLFSGQELVLLLYSAASSTLPAAADIVLVSSSIPDSGVDTRGGSHDHVHAGDLPLDAASSVNTSGPCGPHRQQWVRQALQQLGRLHKQRRLKLKLQEIDMLLTACRRLAAQQQYCQPGDIHTFQRPVQPLPGLPLRLLQQLVSSAMAMAAAQESWEGSSSSRSTSRSSRRRRSKAVCSCRDASGILYSLAVLGMRPSSTVITQLVTCYTDRSALRRCTPVDVTNTLYALALLKHRPQELQWWRGLLGVFLRRLQGFAAAELIVCIYSLARLGVRPPPPVLAQLVAAAAARLQPHQHQEVAMLVWALGKLRFRPAAGVMNQLATAAVQASRAAGKIPADLTASASGADAEGALRTAGGAAAVRVPSAVDLPGQELHQQQQQDSAMQVSMLVLGCGKLRYCPRRQLLQLLLQLCQQLLPRSSWWELSCMVYGFAGIGVRPSATWLQSLQQRLEHLLQQQRQPDPTRQGLLMVIWGLVQMSKSFHESTSNSKQQLQNIVHCIISSQGRAARQGQQQQPGVMLSSCPETAGLLLWSLIKLGVKVQPELISSALQSFLVTPKQQSQQQAAAAELSNHQQQQQEGPGSAELFKGRRAQSLALTLWAVCHEAEQDDAVGAVGAGEGSVSAGAAGAAACQVTAAPSAAGSDGGSAAPLPGEVTPLGVCRLGREQQQLVLRVLRHDIQQVGREAPVGGPGRGGAGGRGGEGGGRGLQDGECCRHAAATHMCHAAKNWLCS
jgi:hypothetical protein